MDILTPKSNTLNENTRTEMLIGESNLNKLKQSKVMIFGI